MKRVDANRVANVFWAQLRPELLESAEFIDRKSKRLSRIAPFHAFAVANMNWSTSLIDEPSPAKRQETTREQNSSTQARQSMVGAISKQRRITRLKRRQTQHLHGNTTAVACSSGLKNKYFLRKPLSIRGDWAACYSEKFQLISPIAVKNQSATTNAPKAQLPPLPTAHSQTNRPINANTIWIKMSCSTGNARSRSLNMDQQIDHSFHH